MKINAQSAFRTILAGSILAFAQRASAVGEPVFAARPVVSNDAALNPDVPATLLCGKTLVIPLVADDPEGGPLSYSVTTSQPWLVARVRTGHPVMKMRVRSTNDGAGAPIDGIMEFALFRANTRDTADFIGGFAQSPYYENVLFHRVIKDFVLQGGDKAGTGSGPSPYVLPHEFRSQLVYSGRGQLAMANSSGGYTQTFASYGRSFSIQNGSIEYRTANTVPTNGTQFFITLGQPRHLDFKHTLFGQLLRGFDVMDKVENVPVNSGDKPTADVTMSEVSVNPSSSDGVLLVSAMDVGTGSVTVIARDLAGNTAEKTYALTSVKDTVNNSPILAPLEPQVVAVGSVPRVSPVAEDLEGDGISIRLPLQLNRTFFNGTPSSTEKFYAGLSAANLGVVSRPTAGAWDITVGVTGFNESQSALPPNGAIFQLLEVGMGDKIIEGTSETLEAKAGVATGSVTIASFRTAGTVTVAGDFIASVIWGDGSAMEASNGASPNLTVVPSATKPGVWDVKGDHTFVRAGVYPVHVTIDGPLGATEHLRGSAVVAASGALFSALGQHYVVKGATFSTTPIAVISDTTVGVKPTDFSTVIDWGDGERTDSGATVRQIGAGRFGVFATHRYADAETYSAMVTVKRAAFSASAWSTLEMTGFKSPRYLPPFAKPNLFGQWTPSIRVSGEQVSGLPTKRVQGAQTTLTGYLSLQNTGSKTATAAGVRFFLSNDTTLVKDGNGADTALRIGPAGSTMLKIPIKALRSGQGGVLPVLDNGALDFTVRLPQNETGTGKYLITELDYSDPITDNMAIGKTVVFGPFQGINVKLPRGTPATGLVVTEGAPSTVAGVVDPTKKTFTVALDTLPTANVTIPLEVLDASGVADNSQVTLSAPQIVFTPQDGTQPHTVTISSINNEFREDSAQNIIRLRAATSTDTRFSNMDAQDVTVTITDDDAAKLVQFTVSKTTLSVTENGASVSFTIKPSATAQQTATIAVEVVDGSGAISTKATVSPSTVTFTPSSALREQTVTVTAPQNNAVDGTLNYFIRLKPVQSADLSFKDIDLADIPLTIIDND